MLKELIDRLRSQNKDEKRSGNIDLENRPKVLNADGSYSTVRTMTISDESGAINIPTVINGKVVSPKEAIEHYKKTGEHLGKHPDIEAAVKAAEQLHKDQEQLYGK